MTVLYDQDGITVIHGDCREVLPTLRDVDVTITDPPYNLGFDYGSDVNDRKTEYEPWCRDWFNSIQSQSKIIAITPGTHNVAMWCRIQEPSWILAWYKPAAMGPSPFGVCNWEPILFWGKPPYKRVTDVVVAPLVPDSSVGDHPCPKPLKWARELISKTSNEGDLILDPFGGSGTTAVAAKMLGRRCILIEQNLDYCNIAIERLRQSVMPLYSTPIEATHEALV